MGTTRRTPGRESGERAAQAARGGVSRPGHAFPRPLRASRAVSGNMQGPCVEIEAPGAVGGLSDGSSGKIPKAACVSRPEDASGHSVADSRDPSQGRQAVR